MICLLYTSVHAVYLIQILYVWEMENAQKIIQNDLMNLHVNH